MDGGFGDGVGEEGADEIGVAVEIVVVAAIAAAAAAARVHLFDLLARGRVGRAEEMVDVGIAARAQEVVAAAAEVGGAAAAAAAEAGRQRVGDHGHQGSHVGEVGPEPVEGGQVGGVQLAGSAGPEVFGVVGGGEGVEVDDLGAVGGGDAEDAFGWEGEGEAGAGGQGVRGEEVARGGGDGGVEGAGDVEGRVRGGREVGGEGVGAGSCPGWVGGRGGLVDSRCWVRRGLALALGGAF